MEPSTVSYMLPTFSLLQSAHLRSFRGPMFTRRLWRQAVLRLRRESGSQGVESVHKRFRRRAKKKKKKKHSGRWKGTPRE